MSSSHSRKLQLSYELVGDVETVRRGTYVTTDDYDLNLLIGDDNVA